jgi:hypothetical protein
MSRSTRSAVVVGVVLTVLGALVIDHGSRVGLQLIHFGEMGLAVGAVLGLVPDRMPAARAGAFVIGFLVTWGGFALRAGFLPDIPLGRAIATAIVLAVVTAATAVSFGRLPLWAGLLGVAAFSGGYETTYSTNPAGFVADSMTAATTIALAVGLGFLAVTLVDGLVHSRVADTPPHVDASPPAAAPPPRRHPVAAALPTQRDADTAVNDSLVAALKGEDAR